MLQLSSRVTASFAVDGRGKRRRLLAETAQTSRVLSKANLRPQPARRFIAIQPEGVVTQVTPRGGPLNVEIDASAQAARIFNRDE
jgi:hypothetical protein